MSADPNRGSKPDAAIDFFSKCFGCSKEFRPGDVQLRFSFNEWEEFENLDTLPVDIDIGMCEDCIEPGNFKTPEVVSGL